MPTAYGGRNHWAQSFGYGAGRRVDVFESHLTVFPDWSGQTLTKVLTLVMLAVSEVKMKLNVPCFSQLVSLSPARPARPYGKVLLFLCLLYFFALFSGLRPPWPARYRLVDYSAPRATNAFPGLATTFIARARVRTVLLFFY